MKCIIFTQSLDLISEPDPVTGDLHHSITEIGIWAFETVNLPENSQVIDWFVE